MKEITSNHPIIRLWVNTSYIICHRPVGCKFCLLLLDCAWIGCWWSLFDVEIEGLLVACPGEIADAKEDRETQQRLNDARWWWEGFWRTSLSNMLSCVEIVYGIARGTWHALAEKECGRSCISCGISLLTCCVFSTVADMIGIILSWRLMITLGRVVRRFECGLLIQTAPKWGTFAACAACQVVAFHRLSDLLFYLSTEARSEKHDWRVARQVTLCSLVD